MDRNAALGLNRDQMMSDQEEENGYLKPQSLWELRLLLITLILIIIFK